MDLLGTRCAMSQRRENADPLISNYKQELSLFVNLRLQINVLFPYTALLEGDYYKCGSLQGHPLNYKGARAVCLKAATLIAALL